MRSLVLVAILGCLVAFAAAGSVSRYEKRTENRTRCPHAEDDTGRHDIDFITALPPFVPQTKRAGPIGTGEVVGPATGFTRKNWSFCKENKKFYLFSTDRDTWHNANLKCAAMKGELAVVRDRALEDWILQNTPKQGPFDGWTGFWTGLRRTDQNECVFGWLDWTDFVTLSSEKHVKSCCDCASLETGGGKLEWRQAFCHNERRYICEHNPRKSDGSFAH